MLSPTHVDLFPELAIHILSYLSLPDIFACLRTHTVLYKLIKESTVLQYHINTQLAGVEDNPCSTIAVHERLDRLNLRETGWAQHEFDFSRTIAVPPDHSWIRGLTGGVVLLGARSRRTINYCTLPSKASDGTRWSKINVDANVIAMGLAIYEHDLIAVVITTPQDNVQNVEIVLLEFSTGARHQQARCPQFFVTKLQGGHPCISVGISGDTLALVITYHSDPPHPEDNVYIFDWKAGVLKMHRTAPGNSYSGLVFLTPTLLLLPNAMTGVLEFWDPAFAHPIGALGLPHISDDWAYRPITCRCEPNPTPSGKLHSPHPFHASPPDALALFNIRVQSNHTPPLASAFSMFVHRRALQRLCPPPPSADIDTGTFAVIPWGAWGPRVARWMSGEAPLWMNLAGERAIMVDPDTDAPVIMDFHPWRLRASRGRREKKALRMFVMEMPVVQIHPAFVEQIDSWLPYVTRTLTLKGIKRYDGLLMDEERLVGLKMDEAASRITEIVIHHLGAKPQRKTKVGRPDPAMRRLWKMIRGRTRHSVHTSRA